MWMTLLNHVGPREPDTQRTYCRIQFVQFKEKTQAQLTYAVRSQESGYLWEGN